MAEIRQLQRRVHERVLERAAADAKWRRQLLEDPQTAMGGIPEARQLREMRERATMPTPPPEGEYRQLTRSLMEKILDRAASDPLWKQQVLDNPEAAMREANFPEFQRLEEMRQSAPASQEEAAAEVQGQSTSYPPWVRCRDPYYQTFY